MSNGKQNEVELPPIAQVGMAVRNVDETAAYYTQLGFGPFDIMEVAVEGFTYKGKPCPHKVKLGFSKGTPQIELIETLEGDTPNSDFLKAHGEGISHFRFDIERDQYDTILAAWAKEGIEPIFYRISPEMAIAYFNTDKKGGIMTELLAVKKKE